MYQSRACPAEKSDFGLGPCLWGGFVTSSSIISPSFVHLPWGDLCWGSQNQPGKLERVGVLLDVCMFWIYIYILYYIFIHVHTKKSTHNFWVAVHPSQAGPYQRPCKIVRCQNSVMFLFGVPRHWVCFWMVKHQLPRAEASLAWRHSRRLGNPAITTRCFEVRRK